MQRRKKAGFSILELVFVMTIIGLVALIGVPEVTLARDRTAAIAAASDLRVLVESFEFYSTSKGSFPAEIDSEEAAQDIAEFIPAAWSGDQYSWEYVNTPLWTFIFVSELGFTAEQALRVDSVLDDGNVASGKVRIANGGDSIAYFFRSVFD